VVIFDLELPLDYPTAFREGFRSQDVKSFRLQDGDGNEVPYQRLSFDPQTSWRSRYALPAFVGDPAHTRYTVAAEVDLPALGFTSLLVTPSERPVRRMGSLRTGPTSAENEHLALSIQPNGTLTLTDKAAGQVYTDLLIFEDRSEIGDGWFHGDTVNDEIALSTGSQAQVSVVDDGPDLVTFRIQTSMSLPERYDWHKEKRSDRRTDLDLTSFVSLRRGSRTVEVETVVDNNVEDHRLRLLLPTDIPEAKTWLSHQPYDVLERDIALDPQTADWQEPELAEKPFQGFQAVGAGNRGLAFLSAGGLHEGGVQDDARRTMQVTLLRSYRRTVGTTGEQDGLELGKRTYRYALMPFAGELPRVEVLREVSALQAGLMVRQTGPLPSGFPPMAGNLPPRMSYVEQERATLVMSALKPADDGSGLVVRLWNPSDRKQSDRLTFWQAPKRARRLNLAEQPLEDGDVPVHGRTITVETGPKQVVTVGLEF
jgi:alpha-mannosidase